MSSMVFEGNKLFPYNKIKLKLKLENWFYEHKIVVGSFKKISKNVHDEKS